MEGIQNDLDVIRSALARSLCHHPTSPAAAATAATTPHDEKKDVHRTGLPEDDSGSSGCKCHRPMGASPPPNEDAAAELTRLREKAAALSLCEVERSRLEVEVASKEAALRQCMQAHHALQQREREQAEQLRGAAAALAERQAELVMWRERHQRLRREADALRQELDTLTGQCDAVEVALCELRGAVRQAADENDGLRRSLRGKQEECDALREKQVEHDAVAEREAALRDELRAVHAANEESLAYLSAARAEIEARRQYWASVQEEHVALQEALVAAQAAASAWETRFVLEQAAPPLPVMNSDAVRSEEEESQPFVCVEESKSNAHKTLDDSNSSNEEEEEEEENYESTLAALEAKIVDLALHLQEQSVVAAAANESYATLANAVKLESRELLETRCILAAQRPEWTHLSETNQKLQAVLVAQESHVEALQELIASLLDELTEQSLYCYALETQLAVRVVKGGTVSASASGATRRSTALQFMQQQQERGKFCNIGGLK